MSKCNNLNCCKTIKKTCNCCDYNHICTPQCFIQLYDKTLVNELTDSVRFLRLSNDKMNLELSKSNILLSTTNQSFSTGGYTISTTTIKNDTLNLPGPGTYQISLRLISKGLADPNINYMGAYPPITYSVLFEDQDFAVTPSGMVPTSDLPSILLNDVLLYTLYRGTNTYPSMRIYLQEFDFNKVLNNKLIVDNMILVVQKIQNL